MTAVPSPPFFVIGTRKRASHPADTNHNVASSCNGFLSFLALSRTPIRCHTMRIDFVTRKIIRPVYSAESITRLRELWQVVDDAIAQNDWMLGNHFSAVDIYLFMLTTWLSEERDHPTIDEFGNVNRIASAVASRPRTKLVYGLDGEL